MARKSVVKLTANFERNLDGIEQFLSGAGAAHAYERLVAELLETGIPNLESFPAMGRPFLARKSHAVETENALAMLRAKLAALRADADALREIVVGDYLLLYVVIGSVVYLLSIKLHRQLSFDFQGHWETSLPRE